MVSIYQVTANLERNNQPGALCIIIRTQGSTPRHVSSKMVVYPDGSIDGTVGGGLLENYVVSAALHALNDGKPRMLTYDMVDPQQGDPGNCGGRVEIYVEPILPKPILLIVGSGHVGKALAHLAHWLGFRVVISDDRPEFCTPEAIPEADEYYPVPMAESPRHFSITTWTYIILTTRGVSVDVPGLPALLDSPAAYLGVIGSHRRWATTRRELIENGVSEDKVDKVHSPIGLELSAETPEEISVSIMAEIIMIRNGGNGKMMDASKTGVEILGR